MKVGKQIMSWDTSEIFRNELEFRQNERKSELESGEISQEQLENSVYNDSDLISIEWDSLTEYLTETISRKNPDGYWKAVVNNFGWRKLNGHKFFRAENGTLMLREILPKTDCTFHIFNYGKGIAIQNYHHDSPTGNEWYYITPCAYSTFLHKTA